MCDVVSFVGAAERVLRARFRPSPESGPPVHARRCGWSLGISAETLRRWAGQAEVDSGVVAGVSASRSGSVKTSELEQPSKYSRSQRVSSRGSATRDTADLCVRRQAQAHLRGHTDLSGTGRARRADRLAHLFRGSRGSAFETRTVGHHNHRNPGRLLRTRRRGQTPTGMPVRQPEDVGAPAAPGLPVALCHGEDDHAGQRLARSAPRSAHHTPPNQTRPRPRP